MRWVARNIVSLACVAAAAFVAVHGVRGWGWFLFVAWLTSGSPAHVLRVVMTVPSEAAPPPNPLGGYVPRAGHGPVGDPPNQRSSIR